MHRYIIKRIIQLIPVLILIVLVSFLLMYLIPGDVASTILGTEAGKKEIEELNEVLGLNDPIYIQAINYFQQILNGDLGKSIVQKEDVLVLILKAFPATLELALISLIISLIIAVPLGIVAAVKKNSIWDQISIIISQLGVSVPVFWSGILIIMFFSVNLGWLPSFGRGESLLYSLKVLFTNGDASYLFESLRYIALPALSLGFMGSALITRMIRSTMLEVLSMDYIKTAEAKGTKPWKIVIKHAFRNALLPVITIIGLQFGDLIGGSIVVETVFSWPGIGNLVIKAISQRDFPIVQGVILIVAISFTLINLVVDVLYGFLNPKIRNSIK